MKRPAVLVSMIWLLVVLMPCYALAEEDGTTEPGTTPISTVEEPVYSIEIVDLGYDLPDYAALQESAFAGYPLTIGEEQLTGWRHYDIPQKYSNQGGSLPDPVQVYIYTLCKQYHLRYSVVLAIIEVETGYRYDKVTAKKEMGYMQVYYKWHKDKVEDLQEEELLDPYTNVQVGIAFLEELAGRFKTEAEYITAYNMGARGATKYFKKTNAKTSDYAKKVLKAAKRIEKELAAR